MNIKSLLLGSAAALAVVSGAQAADAVVAAEPEPMEYVKVCDAYGTGFFYIPGTETCLKIGGQFRYEKRFYSDNSGVMDRKYEHWTRGRIEVTAKNDSEWGTVSSWIRMENSYASTYWRNVAGTPTDSWTSSTSYSGMNAYWTFGIGGLEMGYYDSQFAQFFGYGGKTDDGGVYINWSYGTRQYMSYTASFDSFSAIISLEQDAGLNPEAGVTDAVYMPDVVVGVKGAFGDYSVAGGFAYDESDESFVVTKKVTGDIDMFSFAVQAFYSNSATNSYFSYDGFSVIAGVSAKVTDTVTLAKDFQYWDDGSWRVVGDVNWAVASGFSVLLEASYTHDDASGINSKAGFLRFQRSF